MNHQVLTWAFCFPWNSYKVTLFIHHQMIYLRSNIKTDTKNHRKSRFNLTTGQFLFSKYKTVKGLHWIACVGSLTKEAWFSKILSKIDISLISFQQLDLNRYDLWNIRVDSRTRKIVKQEEHRSNLQNPWQKSHQHFSTLFENLTT